MSTVLTWQTISTGAEQTVQLAEQIGQRLRGGEVIALSSDLGGGKTTFVRGLAKGMGSTDPVSSPSFTISNEYKAGSLTLYHFDFYRLQDPGIMAHELQEILNDPRAVIVIEWANTIKDLLPADTIQTTIQVVGDNSRSLRFEYRQKNHYLLSRET